MKYTINDIVKQDLCTGCGICVSESPSTIKMQWNEYGFLTPHNINDDLDYNAIRVCPFNPTPDEEVKDEDKLANIYLQDASNIHLQLGRFENTYVGYSNKFRNVASSGGISTFVFERLLKDKIVDHLFIVKEVEGSYEYQIFNEVDQITKISKTRYIPVTLEELFLKINDVQGKIAVSGVACFIKAIRLKQFYHPELKEKIPFLVGIICGGLKSNFFTEYLAQKAGISSNYSNQEYRIKDQNSLSSDYSFGAFDEQKNFHQMKMSKVGNMWGTGLFKANACDFCTDVTTELADISLGDAWIDEYRNEGLGNSIIITRSKIAEKIILDSIENGELSVKPIDINKIIKSQAASFSHRQDSVKLRIKHRKFKNKIIPFVRKRNLKPSKLPYILVQIQRLNTRSKSLKIWKKYKDAKTFDLKMRNDLTLLKILTKINHKLRR